VRRLEYNYINKCGIFILTFGLVISQAGIINPLHNVEQKINNIKQLEIKYVRFQDYLETPDIQKDYPISVKPNYNLDLDEKYQNLIFQLCQKNDLSYEMVLALFYCESEFNTKAIHKNNDNTMDLGIAQVNSSDLDFYKECGVKYCDLDSKAKFNLMNPEQNIRVGIGLITYLKEYWRERGVDNELLNTYIMNSYHEGIYGYSNSIKKTGRVSRNYSKKINKYKNMLLKSNKLETI